MSKRIVNIICILCLASFCLCLSGCSKSIHKVDAKNVEKVTIYKGDPPLDRLTSRTDGVELCSDDRDKLISLYNNASYAGTDRDDSPSPIYACVITLHNGSIIKIDKRHNYDFWLVYSEDGINAKDKYYIQSNQLSQFLSDLIDTLL